MTGFKVFNLNYSAHLLNDYHRLSRLPGFVLLESSDRRAGRYDILSAFPYGQLKISPDSSSIETAFEQLQQLIPHTASLLDLPFQGGAIGYLSYDLAAYLAGIDSTPQQGLNDLPLLDMGLYDWALVSDHHLKKVSLFAANNRPETAEIVAEILARWQEKNNFDASFTLKTPFMPLIARADYQNAFHAIHQDLCRGRSYQVNFTQPFNATYQGDPWTMYRQVRARNPVPYSAFLRTAGADISSFSPGAISEDGQGLFIGFTDQGHSETFD